MNKNEIVQVAKIGRLVGLNGELKLNIHCDFPEQFRPNNSFYTDKTFQLEIQSFYHKKNTVIFKGYQSRESAAKLVNVNLFATKEQSEENCKLEDGEFFWFDMIGSQVLDNDKILGIVVDIQRMANSDYLIIETSAEFKELGLSKLFYLPYIDRYIIDFDVDKKKIHAKDAYEILENS